MNAKIYNEINELLSEYSKVEAELKKTEGAIAERQLKAADTLLPEHAQLKVRLDEIEVKLKKLADANYTDLFPEETKRNHKTPFGELQYRKSSSIEFDDSEKVLLKIKLACAAEKEAAKADKRLPRFTEDQFIRKHEEPNLEAMAVLDDVQLTAFGCHRVHADNFKVKPFAMKTDKPKKAAKAERPELN